MNKTFLTRELSVQDKIGFLKYYLAQKYQAHKTYNGFCAALSDYVLDKYNLFVTVNNLKIEVLIPELKKFIPFWYKVNIFRRYWFSLGILGWDKRRQVSQEVLDNLLEKETGELSRAHKVKFLKYYLHKSHYSMLESYMGFCIQLIIFKRKHNLSTTYELSRSFPELSAYAPEEYIPAHWYWFSKDKKGLERRRNICRELLQKL